MRGCPHLGGSTVTFEFDNGRYVQKRDLIVLEIDMLLSPGRKWFQKSLAQGFEVLVCRNVAGSSSSGTAKSQFAIMSEKFHKPGAFMV